jgi:hypothetical protein
MGYRNSGTIQRVRRQEQQQYCIKTEKALKALLMWLIMVVCGSRYVGIDGTTKWPATTRPTAPHFFGGHDKA